MTTIEDIAACMLEGVPDGTSPIDVLVACSAIAGQIVLSKAPEDMRGKIMERFVNDFYDYVEREGPCASGK